MIALKQRLIILVRYFKYRAAALSKFEIHSPFIYNFYTKTIRDRSAYPACKKCEDARKRLLSDTRVIEVSDLGTGGRELKGRLRSIGGIVKKYACSKKEGQLLFRIVQWQKPATMIELGTSAGIGSLYLKMGNPDGQLITIEGCPNTAEVARGNFKNAQADIQVITGNIDDTLDEAITKSGGTIDFVYFDGNHTCEATLKYFRKCRDAASGNSVFVFGDIHWSAGMERAWDGIRKDPSVKASIDLFHIGIVLFNPHLSKQDFVLKY